MLKIDPLLSSMAKRRPIFCSEADFQHEMAMEIRASAPNQKIRLEYPLGAGQRGAIDLLLQGEQPFALELKYLCKGLLADVDGERFILRQQSAHDIRRHDVCKDLVRMEAFARRTGHNAAVLVLTNDPAYWLPRSRADTVDAAFDIAEARELAGMLQWNARAGAGTTRGRNDPLRLTGRYPLVWRDYSDLGVPAGAFRYLWIPVPAPTSRAS